MEWHLENARFRMTVRETGAELSVLWDNERQRNWIWQPQQGVWNHSATQLFPVVGRLIHHGLWQGERFLPLSAHGFLRHQTFTCVEQGATHLVIEAQDTASTREVWPFAWRVRIVWQLEADGVRVTWLVHNSGNDAWGYSSGWHPGFALPVASEAGWTVRFKSVCSGPFFTVNRTLQIVDDASVIAAFPIQSERFSTGAVYFAQGDDNHWAICSPNGTEQIVFAGNQKWLALWGVPGADLLCVESLSGTTDDPCFDGQLAHKRGVQWLNPGEQHCHWLSVRFPADSER